MFLASFAYDLSIVSLCVTFFLILSFLVVCKRSQGGGGMQKDDLRCGDLHWVEPDKKGGGSFPPTDSPTFKR